MKESKTIADYFSRVKKIINQQKIYIDKIDDVRVIEEILRSVTPKMMYLDNGASTHMCGYKEKLVKLEGLN